MANQYADYCANNIKNACTRDVPSRSPVSAMLTDALRRNHNTLEKVGALLIDLESRLRPVMTELPGELKGDIGDVREHNVQLIHDLDNMADRLDMMIAALDRIHNALVLP